MISEEAVAQLRSIVEQARLGILPEGFVFLLDNDKVKAGCWTKRDEVGDDKFVTLFSYDYSPECLVEDLLTALGIKAEGV